MFKYLPLRAICMAVFAPAIILFAATPQPVSGQAELIEAAAPANSVAQPYGKMWRCKAGFQEVDAGICNKIVLPENAYVNGNTYGSGWSCTRGYTIVENRCRRVPIPEHAYLNTSGHSWECERGYRPQGTSCEPVPVPENGYLVEARYGRGWECDRGFDAKNGACVKIKIPEFGFLSDSSYGQPWDCDRGYVVQGDVCAKVEVPQNAHLAFGEDSWRCNEPFKASGQSCVLPDHLLE